MKRKRKLTKELKEELRVNYLQLQEALVDIYNSMHYELLYGNEDYYKEKLKRLKEFLEEDIYE